MIDENEILNFDEEIQMKRLFNGEPIDVKERKKRLKGDEVVRGRRKRAKVIKYVYVPYTDSFEEETSVKQS